VLRNRHDTWQEFCKEHREVLTATGLPAEITHAEHKLRDLLRDGCAEVGASAYALSDLDMEQWTAFERFVGVFFREFESYAPLDLFPEFRREVERRCSGFRA
jgi:hypothetical protein